MVSDRTFCSGAPLKKVVKKVAKKVAKRQRSTYTSSKSYICLPKVRPYLRVTVSSMTLPL